MAIEHAVLGLLNIQPRHGYELIKEFDPETALGSIAHVGASILYAHLKKLEREGWVSSNLEPQEARPARRVFEITDDGRAELKRWLQEPVERTRDLRLEFLLKLYFARQIDPDLSERLIGEQRDVCLGFIASLEEQLEQAEDDFSRLVIEMRLAQNRALSTWLEHAAREVTTLSS